MNFNAATEWNCPDTFPDLSKYDYVAIDLETKDPNLKSRGSGAVIGEGEIIGFAVAVDGWSGYYPIGHRDGNLDKRIVIDYIKEVCATDTIKIFHNAMYDVCWLRSYGIKINGYIIDTMVMASLIDENRLSYTLNSIAYEYLKYENGDVKYGFSSGKSLASVDSVDMDELRMDHGLNAHGDWSVLNFKDYQKDYIQELVASGEDLGKPARIKLSTIHAVKGEEAENVILFTDLERIIYNAAQVNKDTEHRLFFVGVTRAKENLYIMNQGYEYQYNIGEEII